MNRLRDHRGRFIKTPTIQCKTWKTSWIPEQLPDELEQLVLRFAAPKRVLRLVNRKYAQTCTGRHMAMLRKGYAEAFFLQPTDRHLQYLFHRMLKSQATRNSCARERERQKIRRLITARDQSRTIIPTHTFAQPAALIAPASFSVDG